jgi:hypothetical protein
MNKLTIVPIKQDEAKAFINQKHRHHKAPVGSILLWLADLLQEI